MVVNDEEWEQLRDRVQAVLRLEDHRWRRLKLISFPLPQRIIAGDINIILVELVPPLKAKSA